MLLFSGLCSASQQQAIHVFNLENKDVLNNIRYHDGFRGQKIGPTKCLAFHPHKVSEWVYTALDRNYALKKAWGKGELVDYG